MQARGGEENDICCHECQHMGVPVAHDRCLTEEVREGPCFPGCFLCSMPIAQRNTLSEKQRKKGKGGEGGGVGKGGLGPNAYSPRPQDSGDPAEELRTTKRTSSSTHPRKGTPDKGSPPPYHPHCASAGECSHWLGPHSIWELAICRLSPSAGLGSEEGRDVETASTGGLAGAYLLGDFLSLGWRGWIQAGFPSGPRLIPLAPLHQNATPPRMEDSKVMGRRGDAHLPPRSSDSPGGPDDGNAMSSIDSEGQGPREMAGLLNQIMLSTPGHRSLEVCIECIAVQLHQIQDGSCQGFYHLLCEREGPKRKLN